MKGKKENIYAFQAQEFSIIIIIIKKKSHLSITWPDHFALNSLISKKNVINEAYT